MQVEVDDAKRQALLAFAELVASWGQRTDLVSARTPTDLVDVLFADALVLSTLIPANIEVGDVGAGAGAPAIPLAILRPDLSLVAIEPRRKRVMFMRTAIGKLGLGPRVRVEEGRVAEPAERRFDAVFSRATFEPETWLRIGNQLAPLVYVLLAGQDAPAMDGVRELEERHYASCRGVARSVAAYGE